MRCAEMRLSGLEKGIKLQADLPSGGGAGAGDIFDVALCDLVVRRLRTKREHFKNVV